jgi:hypothetical protein
MAAACHRCRRSGGLSLCLQHTRPVIGSGVHALLYSHGRWAAETTPEVLLADAQSAVGPEVLPDWVRGVAVPMLTGSPGGRRMHFSEAQPDALAKALASQLASPADYRQVERHGAARAAAAIAELM